MGISSLTLRIAFGLGLVTVLAALAQQRPPAPTAVKPAAAAPAATGAAPQQALVDQYCIMCHSEQLKTAGVVLEGSHIDRVGDNTALWEKVLRKYSTGQMPPPGMPRPEATESANFTNWLESQLNANAVAHPNPGAPAIHRLNRLEYGNTIRDLLGLEVDVNTLLPGDDSGYGFDNIADVLSVSPVLLEKYMSASRKISRVAVGVMDIPAEESEFIVPFGTPNNVRVSDDQPLGSRGGYSIHYNFPTDAEYIIRVTMNNGGDRGPKMDTRMPVKAGPQVIGVSYGNETPMAENTGGGAGRGGAGGAGTGPGGGQKLDLRMNDVRVKLLDPPGGGQRGVFSLSVLGPYNPTGPGVTPSRQKIFVCTPTAPAQEETCARQILTNLTHHAYRRPVTSADVSPLMGFYQRERAAGKSFDKGIESALRATLVSPSFLFREEQDPAGVKPGSAYKLTDYELASRLSYFLWSSMPDDELMDLAQKGRLRDTAVLDQQVRRMLADKKSDSLVTNFAGQWLFLRNVESDKKDKDAFPDYDQSLRNAFKTETEMLFSSVLEADGSLLDLLRSNYTFVNERLAKHYGIPDVYGPAFRKVTLTDPNRFGLLGQGSLLTVTSLPNRTSVVQRGKWILENLLGAPPPPPPPGAADGFVAHGSGGHLTLRQAMEQHRADPSCAVCHTRMDPLGFALENYNGIGKWRVMDDTGAKIDAVSTLPDGTSINGPAGLTNLLLTGRKVDFVNTFTTKLMTYALGRGVESYDQPVIRSITRDAARDDYRMSSLILGVIHSAPFQMRRAAED